MLPEPLQQWLEQAQKGKSGAKAQAVMFPDHPELKLQYMGNAGPNEFLLRLAKDAGGNPPAEFSSELGLTTREGEVLSWLSKGKTNRDIAQILGLSPRTVDKHLEQIYAKLGVENRTAAAAIATNAARKNYINSCRLGQASVASAIRNPTDRPLWSSSLRATRSNPFRSGRRHGLLRRSRSSQ